MSQKLQVIRSASNWGKRVQNGAKLCSKSSSLGKLRVAPVSKFQADSPSLLSPPTKKKNSSAPSFFKANQSRKGLPKRVLGCVPCRQRPSSSGELGREKGKPNLGRTLLGHDTQNSDLGKVATTYGVTLRLVDVRSPTVSAQTGPVFASFSKSAQRSRFYKKKLCPTSPTQLFKHASPFQGDQSNLMFWPTFPHT